MFGSEAVTDYTSDKPLYRDDTVIGPSSKRVYRHITG